MAEKKEDAPDVADNSGFSEHAREFFNSQLRTLKLTPEQVDSQTLPELRVTLQRVNDALLHPESFGVFQISPPSRRWPSLARRTDTIVVRIGILPLLLQSKAHIEDRLEDLGSPKLSSIGIDSIIKSIGLIGVATFAMLFAAYYQFYSAIGIRPEDVGVNYAYVIARSLGLAFILVGSAAYFANGIALTSRASRQGRGLLYRFYFNRNVQLVAGALLILGGIAYFAFASQSMTVRAGLATLSILGGIAVITILLVKREVSGRVETISYVACSVLSVAVALAFYAHGLGAGVRGGSEARPLDILGAPLLDVRARPVTVQWVGPEDQRPDDIFWADGSMCAVDVGRTSSTQFLIQVMGVWQEADESTPSPTYGSATPVMSASPSTSTPKLPTRTAPTRTSPSPQSSSPVSATPSAEFSTPTKLDSVESTGLVSMPIAMVALSESDSLDCVQQHEPVAVD